jgi:hypothetical protein
MSRETQKKQIEDVLVHVRDHRRNFLRHLLTATGGLLMVPLISSTAVALWPEDECYFYERKVKKGKWPGEFSIEVKKKKCPPDEFWGKGKKGKRFDEFWGKGKVKKVWYWTPDE